jgi:hypothetical protein
LENKGSRTSNGISETLQVEDILGDLYINQLKNIITKIRL